MLDSVGGKVIASMGKKMEKSQTELTKRQASALMTRKLGRDKRVPNCTVLTHPRPNYIITNIAYTSILATWCEPKQNFHILLTNQNALAQR